MDVPTIEQRQQVRQALKAPALSTVQTLSPANAKYNLNLAQNNYNNAMSNYQKALANEINKTGIDYRPKFDNLSRNTISYQTKNEDKQAAQNKLKAIPMADIRKNIQEEINAANKAKNDLKIADYQNNMAKAYSKETTNLDRLATPIRAVKDLLSPLTQDIEPTYDENGNRIYLPTYDALRQQKVREDTTGLGGVLMDVGYNTTKILGAGAIDLATAGLGGKALYWTDMAADNFKNIKNQGYDNQQAALNTIISTGSEYLTERLLGGLAGKITGGQTSEVQNIFSNVVNKAIKNPKIANIIGSMGSEGLEEFTQEFIGAVNDKITLGQDKDIVELMQDALYSGLVGAGSAGLTTGARNTEGRIANQNVKGMQNTLNYLNNQRNNVADTTNVDAAISEAQNYINRPFTYDYNRAEESTQKAMNDISKATEALNLGNKIDNNAQKSYNMGEKAPTYKEITSNTVKATIAPYYDTPLTKENYNEIKGKVDTSFRNTAQSITNLLGGKIKDVSSNIGGFTFEEGKNAGQAVRELSYTFDLENVSREDAQLMTSLMGDLAHEQQEAVIAATYEDVNNSNALEYRVKVKDLDNLMNALEKAGINDFTIDENNSTLKLLEFDVNNPEETAKKIADLYEVLGDDILNAEYTGVQSDYITKSDRKRIYKTWLDTHQGSETNRELRSLVEDAYKKVEIENEGTSDSSFSNEQNEQKNLVKTQEFKDAQKKVKDGTATKEDRSFIQTAVEAQHSEEIVKQMDEQLKTYEVQSNKDSISSAEAQLSGLENLEEKVNYVDNIFKSGKRITASDMAAAELVLKDVLAAKDAKLYNRILADTAILGTEYGQVIQIMSRIKDMSPTGQLDTLEKIINREKAKGNKAYSDLKITDEMRNRILDCYDENGKVNQEQFDETMESIKQELADNLKVGAAEKARAWRYLSMLGNPKTHVRNELANVAMSTVKLVKDTISAVGQDTAEKLNLIDKTQKTATLKSASDYVKNLASSTYEEVNEQFSGNKYNEQSDLENRKQVFKTGWLEKVRKLNERLLSKEDQDFKKLNYKRSFANYLTAQGISTEADIENNPGILEKAKQFAINEANVATFNQPNKLAEFINSADNKLGGIGRVIRGAIIPFTRTPLNIAKTGIEYTPGTGLLTTIADFRKAPDNMKGSVLIDGISKQITGTSLALLGYALAKSGRVVAENDDDKEDKFKMDQGTSMDYSIKIGDTSYDLSWLSPSSMPFFVGARMFEVLEKQEGINENIIMESLASTLDPLSEMSCISSFTDVLQSYSQEGAGKLKDIGVSTMQNYLSQFVPTVSGQFARLFDDKKRTTMPDKNAPNKISQETYRTLAYKIPGLRNTLPTTTDYLGRDKKEEENVAIRAFDAFLNPANKKKDTMTKEGKEVIRLYEKTGNSDILPTALAQNVKYNDSNYTMSRREYNAYKKDFGDAYSDNLKSLMKTDDYKDASDDEKAKMIAGIMTYSKDKAKDIYLTDKGEDYSSTSDEIDDFVKNRMSISDYYALKVSTTTKIGDSNRSIVSGQNAYKNIALVDAFNIDAKDYLKYAYDIGQIKADKNSNGESINGTAKRKKIEYIQSLPLSAVQKQMLYSLKVDGSKKKKTNQQVIQTIQDSNLSEEEKQELYSYIYK